MNDRPPSYIPANVEARLSGALAELRPLVAEASTLIRAVAERQQKIAEDV